ncbi:hypothetical protein [Lentibacillus cibarius]|uniref:Uncharacterized protein n=1 Tax=Lentibacillus cibarius TaxID=2583219 RepID=A0A5S3QLJ5_9BACI|nr:hypothetical protein [Lentibacillus cibarius]TMN22628.1 hypothetical protein FFL34_11360 [Lentibacillus cibarius]
MSRFTVREATKFFRSSGADCNETLVQEWMNDTKTMNISYGVTKSDFISFDMWNSARGTAYENGISDKERIARLLVEINDLKTEILTLTKEKEGLEDQLGIMSS